MGKRNTWLAMMPCLLAAYAAAAENVQMRVWVNAQEEVIYKVDFEGRHVIGASPLGLNIDNRPYGKEVIALEADTLSEDHILYTVKQRDDRTFQIETKVFDDGMALRYHIPTDGKPVCIYGEETSYQFPQGTRTWYASGPFQYGWVQAYQDRKVEALEGELLAPPATFLTPDGIYAALTEANLFHYHGAVLFGVGDNRVQYGYVENKGHLETGTLTGMPPMKYAQQVVRDVPWIISPRGTDEGIVTPWRVLMLANSLNDLVNNSIIQEVADQPDPELFPHGAQTEWIKPGRAVFTWLVEGGVERLSVQNHMKYVDGCAELGIETVVVDDGWELWPETEPNAQGRTKWNLLSELVSYAKGKGVDIWVWRPSSPRAGNRTDIGLIDDEERRHFMEKCAEIGVKGLKIDFFHSENLFTVTLMEDILRDAAKAHLMVIFHGVNKPTGDTYTYPNLLAKEAVRGLESVGGENSWAPGPAWTYHNTVLPFTRWLAGPADYTPLNFRAFCPKEVTFAHQLATIYMFTSPMLIFAADMEDMLNCPARRMIEEVPVTWDETVALPESAIGEIAAIARRKGEVWYLSVLNGSEARTFQCQLDFLPKGRYKAEIACDKPGERRSLEMKTTHVRGGGEFRQELQAGGGFVMKITR